MTSCTWCSAPLPAHEGRGRPRKYCSDPCREKGRLFVEKQRLAAIVVVDAGPRISYCRYCGKEIVNGVLARVRVYCNKAHKSRYYRAADAAPATTEEIV